VTVFENGANMIFIAEAMKGGLGVLSEQKRTATWEHVHKIRAIVGPSHDVYQNLREQAIAADQAFDAFFTICIGMQKMIDNKGTEFMTS
jgi:hypothetical protein